MLKHRCIIGKQFRVHNSINVVTRCHLFFFMQSMRSRCCKIRAANDFVFSFDIWILWFRTIRIHYNTLQILRTLQIAQRSCNHSTQQQCGTMCNPTNKWKWRGLLFKKRRRCFELWFEMSHIAYLCAVLILIEDSKYRKSNHQRFCWMKYSAKMRSHFCMTHFACWAGCDSTVREYVPSYLMLKK